MKFDIPWLSANLDFSNAYVFGKQCRGSFNCTRHVPLAVCREYIQIFAVRSLLLLGMVHGSYRKISLLSIHLVEAKAMATASMSNNISNLTVDQGYEYCSNDQKRYYEGIQIDTTAACTSRQNGVAEKFNETIIGKDRSMQILVTATKTMWGKTLLVSVYLANRSQPRAIVDQTLDEAYTIFGQTSDVRMQGFRMEDRNRWIYTPNGLHVWNVVTRQLFISRDDKFHEA